MKRLPVLFAAVLGWLFLAGPVSAHHSTAMYGPGSRTVTGKVVKFEWTNPHAHVYIETKDEKGATVVWDCELMSLNHLKGFGWTAKTVKVGDVISATGQYAKSGDPAMIAGTVKLADGRDIRS
jgi:tRNA(Ile2) C34 agmatinyltransferase TiaS